MYTAMTALPDLPAPAIELIARHVLCTWDSCCGDGGLPGSDPQRHVLPLVSRSWRRALQLMPAGELWETVRGRCVAAGSLGLQSLSCDPNFQPWLVAAPKLQVTVGTADLFPAGSCCSSSGGGAANDASRARGYSSSVALGRMQAWFAAREGLVKRLVVRLRCTTGCCRQAH